jgi:REP element-mobilizing transposase RayT
MTRNVPRAEPLAYFLTWTTYGTWLTGDEHGSFEFHKGFQAPNLERREAAAALMTEEACFLDSEQRRLVEETITRHCQIRGWRLHAVNCRTNHVHVVVTADRDPATVMEQFKAWSTRRLKEQAGEQLPRLKWWTERGSKRYINDEDSLEAAIKYVLECQ